MYMCRDVYTLNFLLRKFRPGLPSSGDYVENVSSIFEPEIFTSFLISGQKQEGCAPGWNYSGQPEFNYFIQALLKLVDYVPFDI